MELLEAQGMFGLDKVAGEWGVSWGLLSVFLQIIKTCLFNIFIKSGKVMLMSVKH